MRFILWSILMWRCSTAHPTPAEVEHTGGLGDIGRHAPTTQDPRGAPPQRQADKPDIVQIFEGESFVMVCPNRGNWTALRNTSTTTGSQCRVSAKNRKEYGPLCYTSYMYEWQQGLYWCKRTDGVIYNLRNLTVYSGTLILQPSVIPIAEGDDVILTCRTRRSSAAVAPQGPARFYKDDTLLQERFGRRLTVPGFSASHAGHYKCAIGEVVSPSVWLEARKSVVDESHWIPRANGPGSGSLSVTVDGVRVMTTNAVALAGQTVVFRCNNTGNSSGPMAVWSNTPLNRGARMCGDGICGERRGPVCSMQTVHAEDTGFYFCKSEDGESETPRGITVKVARWRGPDRVVLMNRGSWQVPDGELIVLTCKSTNCGGRPWSVWMHTGHGVTRCGALRGTVVGSECWLTVYKTDSGTFWCSSGAGYGGESTLTVAAVNSVVMDISPATVANGDDVVLKCALAKADLLLNETTLFYKDNVLVATLPRGYMVIRNFSHARDWGYYKCAIPGRGESEHNLLAKEAVGDVCEMHDPDAYAVTVATHTTPPITSHTTPPIAQDRSVVLVCVIVPLLILALCLVAMVLVLVRVLVKRRTEEECVPLATYTEED